MEESVTLRKLKLKYYIAIMVMCLFVVNDLVFDFLFNFEGSDVIAFCCTLVSALIVFHYTYTFKRDKVEDKFEDAAKFIKSNFDNWQVLFSILDIVCGLISILSGVAFLACFFKIIRFGYIPVKVSVVANKSKTTIKVISKFSNLWVAGRLFMTSRVDEQDKEGSKDNMFKKIWNGLATFGKLIWANKKSIIGTCAAVASGVLTAVATHQDIISFLPELVVWGVNIMPYIAGLVIFGLTELGVTGKGFETIATFFARINAAKEEKATAKQEKQALKAEAKAEKEAKIAAEKQAEEDKKALELLAEKEAAEKAEQDKIAEEQRLLARAKELRAQQEAQAAQAVQTKQE